MTSLDHYLERLHHAGSIRVDEKTLASLHTAHSEAIPFENLDIHLGKPVSSDVGLLFEKMVLNRRGGYCFEQNVLFRAMLEKIGFKVRHALGRTTFNSTVPRPRGHLISLVDLGSRTWIADLGFGGYGLLEPVPFDVGREHKAGGETYRLTEASSGGFELEVKWPEGWKSLYWFDESPCYLVDVDVMNFYHSHSSDSFFYQNRVVALARRDRRVTLTNNELKIMRGADTQTRHLTDELDYRRTLAVEFGIELPADAAARLRSHSSIPAALSAA